MHDLCFFNIFFKNRFLLKLFLIAEIVATRGPLYTCLVVLAFLLSAIVSKQ